ncbi:MAG: UvrD-helicase domain-containing protein [Polyangiaceae bacterium]|nr:UvrD-helicase domain-containing protein [Polyangiaceae bacterium]
MTGRRDDPAGATPLEPFVLGAVDLAVGGLIEAGAGTGKTHAITSLFVRLLIERELAVDDILVVTFTEAATAELRSRLRQRLAEALGFAQAALAARSGPEAAAGPSAAGDDELGAWLAARGAALAGDRHRLATALYAIDRASVFTIHGYCQRLLADSALVAGVPLAFELLADTVPLSDELVADFFAHELSAAEPWRAELLRREKLGPARCRDLALRVLADPELPVVPSARGERPDFGACARALGAARAAWRRAEVEPLLRSPPLQKRSVTHAREDCDELDAWYAAGTADPDGDAPVEWLAPRYLEDRPDAFTRLRPSSLKVLKGQRLPEHPFLDACEALGAARAALARALDDVLVDVEQRLVAHVRATLPARLDRERVLGFDDLLVRARAALRADGARRLHGALARRYPAALVDEFQDTDPIQLEIFSEIYGAGRGALFFVGDPKQAIYSFRGADVQSYLEARRRAPRRYGLAVNRRSDAALLRAFGAIFGRPARPFVEAGIALGALAPRPGAPEATFAATAAAPPGAPLEILFLRRAPGEKFLAGDTAALAALVAGELAAHFAAGARLGSTPRGSTPLGPEHCAVLTRTNDEAFAVQVALAAVGISAAVLGDRSVLASPEATDLARILRAALEPSRLGAALTSELFEVTAADLAVGRASAELARLGERFRVWAASWTSRGFVRLARALVAEVEPRLLARPDGARRLTDLVHLCELCHAAESRLHLGPAALVAWLEREIHAARGPTRREDAQLRLDRDGAAVRVTTVHRSKGLEYPVVYLPFGGLTPGAHKPRGPVLFHDPEDGARLKLALDVGGGADRALVARERLAEGVRLAYVALTRAQHRVSLVWGAFKGFEKTPLAHLWHAPAAGEEPGAALEARVRSLDDDALLAALGAIAATAPGAIEVRELAAGPRAAPPPAAVAPEPPVLAALAAVRRDPGARTASFSELVASPGRGPALGELGALADGRDRDELDAAPARTVRGAPAAGGTAVPLAAFPRGPRAGSFFHELLERLDFGAELDRGPSAELVSELLLAHGLLPVATHREPVCRALAAVLGTELRPGLRLCDVPRGARRSEVEFVAPVGRRRPPAEGAQVWLLPEARAPGVGAAALARALADHPSEAVPPSYPRALAGLGFAALRGHLKGYVDLLFEHDGAVYLVDYKSNHLGDDFDDYAPAELRVAMAEGHYYLQYHLYAHALDRHLALRHGAAYDYERHFGGVLYLFLRGMSPERGAATGVFWERPPLPRMRALADLMSAAERGAARGRGRGGGRS